MGNLFNKRKHAPFNPTVGAGSDLICWLRADPGYVSVDPGDGVTFLRDKSQKTQGVFQSTLTQSPGLSRLDIIGNALRFSEDLTQGTYGTSTAWGQNGITTSIDGTQTPPYGQATKIIPTAALAAHNASQFYATVGPTIFEALCAPSGLSPVTLSFLGGPEGTKSASFNLTIGTIVSTDAGITSAITDKGGGWYLCSITGTRTAKGGSVRVTPALNLVNFTGDGVNGIFVAATAIRNTAWPNTYVKTSILGERAYPTIFSQFTFQTDAAVNRLQAFLNSNFVAAQPITFYFVAKQVTWNLNGTLFDLGAGVNPVAIIQKVATPSITLNAGLDGPANTNWPLDTYAIITGVVNSASSLLQVNNGTAATGNAGTNAAGACSVGIDTGFAIGFGQVQFGELLVYSGIHDENRRSSIQRYLARFWGIVY